MQGADVRMIERGDCFSFALETLAALRIGGEMRRQNLDGDASVQARIACAVHFPHPARAERGKNFIRAELGARGQRHQWFGLYKTYYWTAQQLLSKKGSQAGRFLMSIPREFFQSTLVNRKSTIILSIPPLCPNPPDNQD